MSLSTPRQYNVPNEEKASINRRLASFVVPNSSITSGIEMIENIIPRVFGANVAIPYLSILDRVNASRKCFTALDKLLLLMFCPWFLCCHVIDYHFGRLRSLSFYKEKG